MARRVHFWEERSTEASRSPYRPGRRRAPPRLLTALVTKIRSRQTIGLEWARPATAVFQRTFSPVSPFQRSGRFCPSAPPAAPGPRNEGQLPDVLSGSGRGRRTLGVVSVMRRSGEGAVSP